MEALSAQEVPQQPLRAGNWPSVMRECRAFSLRVHVCYACFGLSAPQVLLVSVRAKDNSHE